MVLEDVDLVCGSCCCVGGYRSGRVHLCGYYVLMRLKGVTSDELIARFGRPRKREVVGEEEDRATVVELPGGRESRIPALVVRWTYSPFFVVELRYRDGRYEVVDEV